MSDPSRAAKPPWATGRRLYLAVVGFGLIASLACNLPGHLSFDSIFQLYEGRTDTSLTFHPWIMSWMLGRFDALLPGTALYVAFVALIFFAALAALPLLRGGRAVWSGAATALALVLSPMVLIYQGIVWKDVLFADLAVAGFVVLGLAVRRWPPGGRRPWPHLVVAAILLGVAALVRQNGLVAGVAAAVALGVAAGPREGWRKGALVGAGLFMAVGITALGLNLAIQPSAKDPGSRGMGLRILQTYDIIGALAGNPSMPLAYIDTPNASVFRSEGERLYSTERNDTFDSSAALISAIGGLPRGVATREWMHLILKRPGLYLTERTAVFRQVFLTPRLTACVPLLVGIDGPPAMVRALNLTEGERPQDSALLKYARGFFRTPVFSHLFYAVAALGVIGILLSRRDPADIIMIGLMAAGLGFAASFFIISIACDYRYLYMLDLAAMVGLIYLALDPPPVAWLKALWTRYRRR